LFPLKRVITYFRADQADQPVAKMQRERIDAFLARVNQKSFFV